MSEKTMYKIVRSIIGAIFLVVLLMMFVIPPAAGNDSSTVNIDNMWEAVHPWHWFLDSVALIGWILFALYLCGLLGKFYDWIQPGENSSGLMHVIGVAGMLIGLLFFV